MSTTTSLRTIEVLRDLFARTGVPRQLVSDNGPQFVATDFQTFFRRNGIRHVTSAPWHPATNGLAERFVQSLKRGLQAMSHEKLTLQQKLSNFLFAYRNPTHATTNQTPAMLFMGRSLRSRLDLIQPNIKQTVQDRQIKQGQRNPARATRSFMVDETVLVRSYRGDCKWVVAVVKEKAGPLMYKVELPGGTVWQRHVDQLRKSGLIGTEDLPTQSADSSVTTIELPSSPGIDTKSSSPPSITSICIPYRNQHCFSRQ